MEANVEDVESSDPPRYLSMRALCPECGDIIKINDPHAFLLALHMANQCTMVNTLFTTHDA